MKIKAKFVDFWPGLDPQDNVLTNALRSTCQIEVSDEPDYLFFSVFGNEHWNYPGCVKIFLTGENICPDFNACDYGIGFECMEYGDRYLRYPIYLYPAYRETYQKMQKKHLNVTAQDAQRKFCSFVYSNAKADPARETFFHALGQYKKIEAGGRVCNNVGGPVKDKVAFLQEHKFDITFENSLHPGYITEKLTEAFAARTVPIYRGGGIELPAEFNPKAMIRLSDFSCMEEAVNFVKQVDQDPSLYLEMLSQPALVPGAKTAEVYDEELRAFLRNIILQPKEQAYRRNMFSVGKDHTLIQMRRNKNDAFVQKIKNAPPVAFALRVKNSLRKNDPGEF